MALVFKDIQLDLSGVPEDKKDEVKSKVADLLFNEVLLSVSTGKSPVAGEANFQLLDKNYAKREKQGSRTPNLQLEGDLLREDLQAIVLDEGDIIRIGHFKESTANTEGEKADGHNQHSAKAQAWALSREFPRRRYIPSEAQSFKKPIMDKVENLIKKYEVNVGDLLASEIKARLQSIGTVEVTTVSPEVTSIGIDDVLSDDFIAQLIADRLNYGL